MTLCDPKPKKNCKLKPYEPLPILDHSGKSYHFKSEFNGLCVIIDDEEDMKKIVSMGCFGKASLSRTLAEFQKYSPQIIRKRVFRNRSRHFEKEKTKVCKIVVTADSESESEDISDYLINLKPEYQLDYSGVRETVNLGLEEAFFLAAALKCLEISYEGALLNLQQVWNIFKRYDKHFVTNYVAYYHFRSKNWVVKSGIKFGGDFLLYKQGPAFFHASYVVIIKVIDENLKNSDSVKYKNLMGLNRLCETAGKELLICEVIWPHEPRQEEIGFEDLPKFGIKETVMKRWISSQERRADNDF